MSTYGPLFLQQFLAQVGSGITVTDALNLSEREIIFAWRQFAEEKVGHQGYE
jgi:hypothetical protein